MNAVGLRLCEVPSLLRSGGAVRIVAARRGEVAATGSPESESVTKTGAGIGRVAQQSIKGEIR